jgi:hypothetical protein
MTTGCKPNICLGQEPPNERYQSDVDEGTIPPYTFPRW